MLKIKDIYGQGMTINNSITGTLITNGIQALDIIKTESEAIKTSFDKQKVLYKYGDLYFNDGIQMELETAQNWETITSAVLPIILTYKDNWNKKYNVLMSEYNPIDNYNKKMEYTTTENGENTDTGTTTNTGELTEESISNSFIYGYDSEDPSNDGKTADNNKSNKSQTENVNLTHGMNKTTTYIETTTGNIGVMDTQTMIDKELQLRNYNLIDEIYQVIIGELTEKY